MHEMMVAQSLLKIIAAEAEKQNAKPLIASISCGVFETINDESLSFAFEAIAKGGICQDVQLKIEHKPIRGQCKKCNNFCEFDLADPICPNCNSKRLDLLPQPSLMLDEIEFESE